MLFKIRISCVFHARTLAHTRIVLLCILLIVKLTCERCSLGLFSDNAVFLANDSESSYKFLCLSCNDVFETFAELKEHRTQTHGTRFV